jgi:hypothetical protein
MVIVGSGSPRQPAIPTANDSHQVWAYDANDLVEVKNGRRQPWDVRPYAVWSLDDMDPSGSAGVRGAAFDPETGRLFITEAYGEEPVVHVYRIDVR